jgi:large subunit ribosomal protein L15
MSEAENTQSEQQQPVPAAQEPVQPEGRARLNSLSPAKGSKRPRKRVGRGIAAGGGKTAGRGHKGQKARSGGNVRPGFEGGQLPLQKRIPAFGFRSRIGQKTAEVRTAELARAMGDEGVVDLATLKAAGIVRKNMTRARVFLSGEVTAALTVRGVAVSKGAAAAIEHDQGHAYVGARLGHRVFHVLLDHFVPCLVISGCRKVPRETDLFQN